MIITHIHSSRFSIILLILVLVLAACVPAQIPSQPVNANPTITTVGSQPSAQSTIMNATPTVKSQSCGETAGKIRDFKLSTKLLKYDLEAKIYLPPCYGSEKEREYPVLYMLHGMTDTDDQWIRLGLTDIADQLISSRLIQPMIIVMPYEISWQQTPEESNFDKAITDVLIPYIEKHYSVCTERDCRAIGGLSRGGNWAVDIGFANWQMFGAVGAHSTPLFYGETLRITQAVQSMPSLQDAPAVYVDAGKKDANLAQVEEFEQTLTELGVDHEYHINAGYHDDTYWSAHTEQYLLWYASKLKAP